MSDLTVGIDIGTTSVKAVAASADGTIVARSKIEHGVQAPDADTFQHDASLAWVDGVLAAWDEVSKGLDIKGVAVSAMVPSLCGVDETGSPVTPGLLYGDANGRTGTAGDGLLGEVAGFARTLVQAPGVRALWPAQAVANHALCGVGTIDTTTAMTMAPLFTGRGWDEKLLSDINVTSDQMPGYMPGYAAIGKRGSTYVAGGTVDALAEQGVADAGEPGDVMVICGTTLIPWALTEDWFEVDGLWTMPFTIPGLIAIGGASNAGGLFIDHVRRLTGDPDQEAVRDVAPSSRPIWLPYLRGERTPFHDHTLRAQLSDFSIEHGPEEVLAAAYDAAGFVVRHHLDLARPGLERAGSVPRRIVATGGGTKSVAWMQALADCTNLPVDVSAIPEGAALGAASMGRLTAGLEDDPLAARAWRKTSHRVEPRADHVDAAQRRYEAFRTAGSS